MGQGDGAATPAVADARGSAGTAPGRARLRWLDLLRGIAILWIVFFHFMSAYHDGHRPWVLRGGYLDAYLQGCQPASAAATALCVASAGLTAVGQLGFHAVGIFLVLSGFGLAYALPPSGPGPGGWRRWYLRRVLRLFPMYWAAHLVYLVSPFQARLEPLDYRFLLSLLGDRVLPIDTLPGYFNPALWYFGLLLQLYLVFPLLFVALRRLGVGGFLVGAVALGLGARYVLLVLWPVSGAWSQGGTFLGRLCEFAVGMAVAALWRRAPARMDAAVFSARGLAAGVALYALGLASYRNITTYVFNDALLGVGLAVILAHVARRLEPVRGLGALLAGAGVYSYGLYLVHQPYVIYFGALMRGLPPPVFLALAPLVIAALALGAMVLERAVNRLTVSAGA